MNPSNNQSIPPNNIPPSNYPTNNYNTSNYPSSKPLATNYTSFQNVILFFNKIHKTVENIINIEGLG